MPDPNKLKTTVSFVVAAIAAVAVAVGWFAIEREFSTNCGMSVEQGLVQASDDINKTLPRMVDPETRVDHTEPGPALIRNRVCNTKNKDLRRF